MKKLTEKFNASIPADLFELGEKLVNSGLVQPVLTSTGEFSVEIDDAEFVETRLFLEGRRLYFTCSCSKEAVCEHVAAALILAERFEDLGFALKKNVAAKLLPVATPELYDELTYEPVEKKKPKEIFPSDEVFYESELPEQKTEPTFEGFPEQSESVAENISKLRKNYQVALHSSNNFQIDYVINLDESKLKNCLVVQAFWRSKSSDGTLGKRQALDYSSKQTPADHVVFDLIGSSWWRPRSLTKLKIDSLPNVFRLKPAVANMFLRMVASTGRLYARYSVDEKQIFPLSSGSEWAFLLDFAQTTDGFKVSGSFSNAGKTIKPESCYLISEGKFFITTQTVEWLEDFGAFELICQLIKERTISLEHWAVDEWLKKLLVQTSYPPAKLPDFLHWTVERRVVPVAKIHLRTAKYKYRGKEQLHADVSFSYNGSHVRETSRDQKVAAFNGRTLYDRDLSCEKAMAEYLNELNFRFNSSNGREEYGWKLLPSRLDEVVKELVAHDWMVTAEGKTYRKPQSMDAKIVASGMDWFELQGSVDFGDQDMSLPEMLAALKKGHEFIRLGDGSFGMLPIEWLKNFTVLNEIGLPDDEVIKFRRSQTLLLDEILKSMPQVSVDEKLKSAALELESFDSLEPIDPPLSFCGTLREYQREALGWMCFLQRFGFGGILADDMGLGKTVQILALLEMRRVEQGGTSLVVAPKSLLFNWQSEALKFAPNLKVLIHSGYGRDKSANSFANYDLILTTYGTLARDVPDFKFSFDYCIIDESQAIKNSDTESSKAVRVVNCKHRLCMSGTPVENSVTDLFSQFEFLNPGMVGHSATLTAAVRSGKVEAGQLDQIRRALLPFILRRTKEEVAPELPPKVEQVIFCEMEGAQREKYEELKSYYQAKLLSEVDEQAGPKMEILSALLRLRQTACHPGLVNEEFLGMPSVKLELLMERIAVLSEEGHKVLVFSQFRSFLYIVRERLEKIGVRYSYIDGTVKDRAGEVSRFQNDSQIKAFLISLKAGGIGLNLTAADYVFILDPWWNPAAEAQAVDRAYRIGQQQHVFAYRMICKDTVEEKVMLMQQKKRQTADALINEKPLKVSEFSREDLKFIFS